MTSIEDLITCEFERFSVNDYRGLPGASEFEIGSGEVPVLVSAPHAVTHVRAGKIKPSEDFTGAIALAVAQRANCHSMVATRTGAGDPNWDSLEASPYKQALCEHVKANSIELVLDVHGMVAASEALVAVGSADGETVAQELGLDERAADLLRDRLSAWTTHFDKPILLNGQLAARGQNTIARTVARECGIPALQIEVATQLRVPTRRGKGAPKGEPIPFSNKQLPVEIAVRRAADPAAVEDLIDALCAIVDDFTSLRSQ